MSSTSLGAFFNSHHATGCQVRGAASSGVGVVTDGLCVLWVGYRRARVGSAVASRSVSCGCAGPCCCDGCDGPVALLHQVGTMHVPEAALFEDLVDLEHSLDTSTERLLHIAREGLVKPHRVRVSASAPFSFGCWWLLAFLRRTGCMRHYRLT